MDDKREPGTRRGRGRQAREGGPGGIWLRGQAAERRERRPLDRERIVGAALEIADEEGLEAVSMRNVAHRLGVGTMTLYSYVESREDLLDLMDDAMMGENVLPDDELPRDWRDALRTIAFRTYQTALRHPWWMRTTSRPKLGPNAVRHIGQSAQAVASAGLSPGQSFMLVSAVDDLVFGAVVRATSLRELRRRNDMSDAEWRETMENLMAQLRDDGDFPEIDAWQDVVFDITDDEMLEQGLSWLFDGVMASLQKPRRGESA